MQKKILVIDDEPNVREYVKDVLEEGHYMVSLAGDGEEGLHKAYEEAPDLIILDLKLPKVHGNSLAIAFRVDERTKHIPIVFLSGMMTREDAEVMDNKLQGQHLLTKPFNKDELLQLLEKLLSA